MKIKRDAVKKIFMSRLQQQSKINTQQAMVLYTVSKGKCEFQKLLKMVAHINGCKNNGCKKVHFGEDVTFIGDK